MKNIILLCALFALTLADSCSYISSDKKWFYNLDKLKKTSGTPYSYKNDKGTYYFNFCEDLTRFSTSQAKNCPQNSAVCLNKDSKFSKLGDVETMMFADSPLGTDKGIELSYGSGDVCSADPTVNYKTLIRLDCSKKEDFNVKEIKTEACTTTITLSSSLACPSPYDPNSNPEVDIHHAESSSVPLIFVVVLVGICALCCACCIRAFKRRACRSRCALSTPRNADYTAVEFQTFNEGTQTESQTLPPPPQYFMMYPPQQNGQYAPPMYFVQPPVQPQVNREDQVANDEAYARQLQEEMNK